jgi:hypothetical protein
MPKYIIATTGCMMPAAPQMVRRHKRVQGQDGRWQTEIKQKETARPDVVRELFEYFSTIDIHDHHRQGVLALEVAWKTTIWWWRLFSTVLGIIVVDAYFIFRYEMQRLTLRECQITLLEFLNMLAKDLIRNPYITTTVATRKRQKSSQPTATTAKTQVSLEINEVGNNSQDHSMIAHLYLIVYTRKNYIS